MEIDFTPRIDGAELLGDIEDFLSRFVAYPSEAAKVAHTLWIAHTHLMSAWESTPRIAFLSPEPGSGKTRALEITELLVPNPIEAVNVTSAYLFRKVADPAGLPTILFDEIDTVFGPKAKENEEIRGLLNAGHRRGAVAGRCVVRGKIVMTEEIPAYCAVALAGLGGLPDTLLSRSVIVRMRRRTAIEPVQPYRRRTHEREGSELRSRLETWSASVEDLAGSAWPELPDGITDRDADIWEPLLVIADLAGGEWPKRARVTAVTLVTDSKRDTPSVSIRLLKDLRTVFGDRDAMGTDRILTALHEIEESPWAEFFGKPLGARGLASQLRKYEISSTTVRVDEWHGKGYKRADLWDAWERYLPPLVPDVSDSLSKSSRRGEEGIADTLGVSRHESVTSVTSVTTDVPATNGHRECTGRWEACANDNCLLFNACVLADAGPLFESQERTP